LNAGQPAKYSGQSDSTVHLEKDVLVRHRSL
jgi:hypothetical protein